MSEHLVPSSVLLAFALTWLNCNNHRLSKTLGFLKDELFTDLDHAVKELLEGKSVTPEFKFIVTLLTSVINKITVAEVMIESLSKSRHHRCHRTEYIRPLRKL